MPIYEYECHSCDKVFEIQQRMIDEPLKKCPDCRGEVKKLVSVSSFQLKGGGWYADGYSTSSKTSSGKADSAANSSPPCKSGGDKCKSCPAAAA